MQRTEASERFSIGSTMPDFTLPDVSGKDISAKDFFSGSRAALVVFTCNHCPYVKGSEAELNKVVRASIPDGLKVISISSNDALQYPQDGFEKMKEKSQQMQLPYPYLYDESQEVARKFDAACTPECYLFDSSLKLVFHGTINDSPKDATKATRSYLAQAISQVLAGKKPDPDFVNPLGCSIKWKGA